VRLGTGPDEVPEPTIGNACALVLATRVAPLLSVLHGGVGDGRRPRHSMGECVAPVVGDQPEHRSTPRHVRARAIDHTCAHRRGIPVQTIASADTGFSAPRVDPGDGRSYEVRFASLYWRSTAPGIRPRAGTAIPFATAHIRIVFGSRPAVRDRTDARLRRRFA